jgi:hypothetical protein
VYSCIRTDSTGEPDHCNPSAKVTGRNRGRAGRPPGVRRLGSICDHKDRETKCNCAQWTTGTLHSAVYCRRQADNCDQFNLGGATRPHNRPSQRNGPKFGDHVLQRRLLVILCGDKRGAIVSRLVFSAFWLKPRRKTLFSPAFVSTGSCCLREE